MMVMAAGGEVNLAGILSSLKPKTASKDDKIEAYTAISNQLKDDALNLLVLDIAKHAKEVMTVLRRDILDSSEDVCQVALQVLGFCLHDRDVISALPSANGGSVLKSLCECIMRTEDKTTCTRALWCLNKQNLTADDIKAEIGNILSAVEHSMGKWKNLSITVEYEAMNVVARLTEQHPKVLSASVSRWTKLILPFIIHDAVKVRELVLETLTKTVDLILPSQKDIVKDLIPEMKTHICPGLKKLMVNKNEIFVLKTWSVVVQILGQELHHGSFINNLLSIVEMGFKSSSADVKCAAFLAWQQLIDNFALNPAVVGDPKRVKLMMQLFKNNNAKVESVAMVKLSVWWHFIWLLGPKASALFDQVCTPLLQFCLGGSKMTNQIPGTTPSKFLSFTGALGTGSSPVTPRINLPSSGSQFSTFPALQLAGCEVLAHFLGSIPDDLDLPPYSFTLDALSSDIITGASFFLKQSNILVSMATDLICSRGKDIPEGLLFRIWYSLIAHMKNAVESGAKSEIRETVTGLLSSFQVIVLSQIFSDQIILKLFQAICCLPRKILCSTAYNMKNGEMIHGTPALFLTELLLTPSLLKLAKSSESFFSLLNTLINYGMSNPSGALEFCYSIVQLLGRNASFVDDGEILWRLWSAIIHPLQEHITQTNEVNQGDVLEYNFDCMYTALVFPISQRLPQNISQASSKTLLKTWTDVYRSFARLSALVTNAEANISCEDLCQRLLDAVNADTSLEPVFLDFLVQICVVVINSVDFSSLGSNTIFNLNVSSPAKRNRRRQKPMENINSLVILTGQLVDSANKVISPAEVPFKVTNGLVDILTMLFTHISSNTIISCLLNELSSPIAELFHGSIKKSGSKIFNNAFCQRLEKLWLDISTCIQGRYSGMYDTELLSKVGPLLEATFLHPRRAIKNQTTILWNATFSRAADLSYPLSLVPVLTKVKEKTPIQLPGWNFQTIIIEETPISQMSQAESQAPAAHIPGMPSPHKIHGSFLGKAISPSVKRSPAKSVVMDRPGASSAFVVIKSPVKKKRVLTEHQKEVLKEKKAFPTMYSNLDVSQDISLMSALNTDTQQSQTIDSPMNTGQSLDFSGFGKVFNKDPEPRIESAKGDYNEKQKIPPADKMKIPSKPARRRSSPFSKISDHQNQTLGIATEKGDIYWLTQSLSKKIRIKRNRKLDNDPQNESQILDKMENELQDNPSKKPVLTKVKEKTPIQLPGWNFQTIIIEETPISQMSQAESQAPAAHIPGMPSPHKIHGSFLGKAISPSVKRSPAKSVVMDRPGASSVKKKLSINDLNDEAFVVIKSPVKKKRVLTEHQKEVLKEKKAFPTMYSNLDVSQDISLMSALNTDTQQSQTIDSPMNTGQSLDFSGFGKVLNKDPEPRIESAKGDYNEKQKIPPADKMKIPSKPARRRSVRFKDSESSVDCEESQKSSFSEILQNKLENGTSLPKDSEEKNLSKVMNSYHSGKSTEKVGENVEPHSQTLFTEASEKSQNSLNVSNSICSPERKKHPLQFVTSPSEAKSPISKPMINRSPSRKSSESLKNVDKKIEMFGKLDQWLIRQPTIKSSVESKTLLSSEASEILTVTVVEDTQSPTKFSQRSEMYNDNQPPIQETPPRKEGEIIGNKDTSSTRQLFKDADDSVINLDESDNIIPSSPPSKKLSLSVRSSPLVKLQKKNDGNKSPNEKDCSADTKEVDVESTRNSIVEDDMDIATSETQEDSNSQGFRISTSTMNSGIQKLISNNKKCVATSSGSSDSSKIEAEQSKIAIQDITESGVSFSDLISQESNRGNESVLEVLATNSDKKDSYSINTPHTSHTVVKHSSNNKEHSSESDSYEDSNLNSSLSNEKEHKRKQATPKKMSLDSVRKSKRKRKMSEKYSEHVKNVESTPKSSKMKKTSEENPSHTSELNLSEQSLDLSSKSSKRKTRRNSVLETKSTKLDSAEVDDTEEKSQIATEEKTPETKTQRTPGRKSTTKQKKEIAQRRSLLREKVRVNQTNTNLERSSSDDEVVFNLSGKKLEARKIMNSDSSEDNLLLSQVKKNVVVSDTKSTEITGNTDVGEKIAITTSSLESSDDDISLKKIVDSRTPNFGNSTRERGHLLANTVTVKENTDQKEIESSTNDPQNESQILDKLENELQDNPSKSDGNSSAKPFKLQNVVSCQKKASLKVSPMSTRLRSSGRVLRTRSKALSRSPLLKKVLKNRKTPQKETRGKDGDSAKVDEVVKKDCLENETVTLIEKDPVKLDEPIEENSEEIGESLDKESGKTDQDKSSKSDDDMIFCDKLSDENQNIWASSVPSVEITVELKESSDSGSDKLSEENVPTEVQSTTEPTTVPEETDKLPNLEETPRSGEKTSAFRAFLSNSDGKLLTASRKFERSPLVRRNIIKPISTLGICSPRRRQSHDFQPIRGIKACSPSASPSAGILKRRRFSVGAVTESPSPPNKQRRVSFAEPLVLKKTEEQRPPSPLVTCASTTNGDATNKSSIDKGKTISQATVSQTSYCSTQESQLNQIEPVYPELVQCQVEVGQVLPQLTSSMWSRGLGQLVRARNIHTVGDLSSLTEREIDSLPIRSPKVATVRRVLQTFESRTKTIKQSPLALEKSIEVNRAEKKNSSDRLPKIQEVEMEDALNDEAQVLPTLEEALSALSPQKVEGSNKTANEDADVLPTLEDALSELSPHKDVESISNQAAASYSEQSLVSSIASLAENCTKEQLKTLQTEDIFKIYQHLNSMTQTVVTALRTKCSPDRTLKK
ncbi:hypothetical protein ScPMuIL_015744 [Solemya velum]